MASMALSVNGKARFVNVWMEEAKINFKAVAELEKQLLPWPEVSVRIPIYVIYNF